MPYQIYMMHIYHLSLIHISFEARGMDEVKQEVAHKEAPKAREGKAR